MREAQLVVQLCIYVFDEDIFVTHHITGALVSKTCICVGSCCMFPAQE